MKNGKVRVIVEIGAKDKLLAVDPDKFYDLGEPLQGDILAGHIIADAVPASWCSVEQKWRT